MAETVTFLDLPGLAAREKAEPGFATALAELGERLGLDPNYIGAVMSLESGFNPTAVNTQGGATGLIQFMPDTAKSLGTTTAALRRMSAVGQLRFVEEYFKRAGRAIHVDTPGDYYMTTFYPAFVGRASDAVIATKGEKVYDQNAGLDADHDGTLTVGDVWAKIDQRVADARTRPPLMFEKKSPVRQAMPGLASCSSSERRPLAPSCGLEPEVAPSSRRNP